MNQSILVAAAAASAGAGALLLYKVGQPRHAWCSACLRRCKAPLLPPPPPAATAGAPGLIPPASQLCTTDAQLTLSTLDQLLGLLASWLRGERYHGQHHLRGAASSLRPCGQGLADLIGNTPLIRITSLSEQTGCEVRASC